MWFSLARRVILRCSARREFWIGKAIARSLGFPANSHGSDKTLRSSFAAGCFRTEQMPPLEHCKALVIGGGDPRDIRYYSATRPDRAQMACLGQWHPQSHGFCPD